MKISSNVRNTFRGVLLQLTYIPTILDEDEPLQLNYINFNLPICMLISVQLWNFKDIGS